MTGIELLDVAFAVVFVLALIYFVLALIYAAEEARKPCTHEWQCRRLLWGSLEAQCCGGQANGALIECDKCGTQEEVRINAAGRLYRIVDHDDHASAYEFIKMKGQ